MTLLLIKSKNHFFQESFITVSELNRFDRFLQQEFNNRNLDVVITSNTLNSEGFNIMGEVIMTSDACCFNLDMLPVNILTVLYDSNLIVGFLMQFESGKLETLERKKEAVPKLCKKVVSSS